MAQFELPTQLWVNKRALPYWIDEAMNSDIPRTANYFDVIVASREGLIIQQKNHNTWGYVPVLKNLPEDNFEVLLKIYRNNNGTTSWTNGGFGLILRQAGSTSGENYCYAAMGSGSNNRNLLIRRYDTLGASSDLFNSSLSSIGSEGSTYFLRVRRENTALKVKAWLESTTEPESWSVSVVDDINKYSNVSIKNGFSSGVMDTVKGFAYATNGDTAQLDLPLVKKKIAHQRSGANESDYSVIKDRLTHNVLKIVLFNSSGTWVSDIPVNWDFYIVDEILSGTFYDFRFAYGDGRLGGDYPDGIVTVDGVPAEAEIDIRLRTNDPVLSGKILRQTKSNGAGVWSVLNMSENLEYDIVARCDGEKDMLAPHISAAPDTNLQPYYNGGWGLTTAKNTFSLQANFERMTPPLSINFSGFRVPIDIENTVALQDNVVQVITPLRGHGRFDFEISVEDSLSQVVTVPVELESVRRVSFVDFIDKTVSVDTGNASSKAITLPTTVLVNDLIVVSVAHRHVSVTIEDNSGQTWQSVTSWGASTYAQGSTIFYRKAVGGDETSRSVTVRLGGSAMLLVHCAIFRGKYAPIDVVRTISSPVRVEGYNNAIKPLTPIDHDSGFLVRSVSNVYALSTTAQTKMLLSGMTMLGVKSGTPYRIQTGYTHLSEPGIFHSTYETGSNNDADIIPDVAIIIDEVRE